MEQVRQAISEDRLLILEKNFLNNMGLINQMQKTFNFKGVNIRSQSGYSIIIAYFHVCDFLFPINSSATKTTEKNQRNASKS